MSRLFATVLLTLFLAASAFAEPYWVAWEGNDWPENSGWERLWGNREGDYQGEGAIRTLEGGTLTYDSLFDDGIYDASRMERPGALDPGPGQLFVMEWRLKVEQSVGGEDPGAGAFSDDARAVGLRFGVDHIESAFEDLLTIPILPGVFHSYRLTSTDMRTYELRIDGSLVHEGSFCKVFSTSRVSFGDNVIGAASVHTWDYFRFGVVPEPRTLVLFLAAIAGCGGMRVVIRSSD